MGARQLPGNSPLRSPQLTWNPLQKPFQTEQQTQTVSPLVSLTHKFAKAYWGQQQQRQPPLQSLLLNWNPLSEQGQLRNQPLLRQHPLHTENPSLPDC